MTQADNSLKRSLGLPSLLFYGVGVIIGAGIYSIIGAAAKQSGEGLWISLLLAAVPALLAALCYAELATRYPRAGATYVYVREAVPTMGWPAFMVGVVSTGTAAATAATVSIAFAGYLGLFLPLPEWVSALSLLVLCTGINIIGIRESAWATGIGTSVEIVGLLIIIWCGYSSGRLAEGPITADSSADDARSLGGIFSAAAICFFVYTGFQGLANLAEETRRPTRNLPLALLLSLGITTVLYVFAGIAATSLIEPGELAASDSPLATAAATVNPQLGTALGWIALFSTANTALITLVVGSRLLFGMAQSGDMPAALSRTLPRRQTPWAAALVILVASAALLPLGGVALVGSIASLLTLVIFLAVAGALVMIRVRNGTAGENADFFHVPLSIKGVPLVPVLLAISVVLLGTQFDALVYAVAGVVLLLGAVSSWVYHSWKRRSSRLHVVEAGT